MINKVVIGRKAEKDLKKVPKYIYELLIAWIEEVEFRGLAETRKVPGYHDEPLHGWRKGQRSIRLNRSYRAIYIISKDEQIRFVSVEEVNKHEY